MPDSIRKFSEVKNLPHLANDSKLKSICIITTSYPSWNEGTNEFVRGKFVHDMAKSFVKAGVDVYVVTHHGKGTSPFERRDGVNIHRFHYFLPRCETLAAGSGIPENIKYFRNKIQVPFYFLSLLLYSRKIIRKNSIDIINAHWAFPTGYIGLMLKMLTGKKLMTTIYGAELFPVVAGKMKMLRPLIRQALSGADLVVGISNETVKAAEKISGRKEIQIIPDGIDIDYYKPGNRDEDLLGKYNCKNKRVIFFTGRMVERKGHRYLLEAMRHVKAVFSDVKLILGGHGPLFDELHNLRKEWNLIDAVEMPGFLPEEEIVPLLRSIDLFVLPSCIDKNGDTEGSATAALEAMACGVPSIVSRVGGNIDSVIEGRGAYYFECANSLDLFNKIRLLLNSEDLMKENKLNARDFVIEHYSWDKTVKQYILLIGNIFAANGGP
jgi:glycosyltransferase involved in cell wall biosynthesis